MRGTNAHFMPAVEPQAETQAVFELEGLADVVVFQPSAREQRHADTGFDVGFDRLAGKLIHKHRRERQAAGARTIIPFPIGIGAAPVAGQSADIALHPAFVPIGGQAQAVGQRRIAGAPQAELQAGGLG